MSWFRSKPPTPVGTEPFNSWVVTATLSDGGDIQLRGSVHGGDPDEMLRVVDGVADGLRRAGFPAEAQIIRERRDTR